MIVVLFGQPNSGKTTLAKQLPSYKNIDGDELRDLFANKDYSRKGRIRNLNRASDIAHYLHRHGNNVVLSLVYPYKEAREYLNSLDDNVAWVYLYYAETRGREQFHVKDFELDLQEEEMLTLNTTELSEEECLIKIKEYVGQKDSR
jgi:adenylylsulfate kinase-like enzyme